MSREKKCLIFIVIGVLCALLMAGCGNAADENVTEKVEVNELGYTQISQKDAKNIMDTEEGIIILDVREQDEFDRGHIAGAILMPYTKAEEMAPEMLPDKDQKILIYCRTGRRSKIAAETLAGMGYTNLYEFGGIEEWPYGTVIDFEKES